MFNDRSKAVLLLWIIHVIVMRMCASVYCCLVVTCWESADLLALVCEFSNCIFFYFPIGILGQVWCLIVLIPDLCPLSYFYAIIVVYRFSGNLMK